MLLTTPSNTEGIFATMKETEKADLPVSRTDTDKIKTSNPLNDKQNNRIMIMKAFEEAKKKAD